MSRHLGWHPDATVRGAVAGNVAGVHAIASREAKKIGHLGPNECRSMRLFIFFGADIRLHNLAVFTHEIAVDARNVVLVLLNDAVFARWRFVTFASGGNA